MDLSRSVLFAWLVFLALQGKNQHESMKYLHLWQMRQFKNCWGTFLLLISTQLGAFWLLQTHHTVHVWAVGSSPSNVPWWALSDNRCCFAGRRGCHCAPSKHAVCFKVQTPRPGLAGWSDACCCSCCSLLERAAIALHTRQPSLAL